MNLNQALKDTDSEWLPVRELGDFNITGKDWQLKVVQPYQILFSVELGRYGEFKAGSEEVERKLEDTRINEGALMTIQPLCKKSLWR